MAVASRNLNNAEDDDLDVDQTAQSIQDQLQQYKLTTFDAARFAGFTNDNDSVLNHVQKGYQQAADIAIDLEQLGESEEVTLVEGLRAIKKRGSCWTIATLIGTKAVRECYCLH